MPKKTNISGPNLNYISDKSLQHSHKAGAKVRPLLTSLDKRWGRYYFPLTLNYITLLEETKSIYEGLVKLIEQARDTKEDTNLNSRFIEYDLVNSLFIKCGEYLTSYSLTLEYFSIELLWQLNNLGNAGGPKIIINDDWNTIQKLGYLESILQHTTKLPNDVNDILIRRDIFVHPTFNRIYTSGVNDWQNNHIAWTLSGRVLNSLDGLQGYIYTVTESFDDYLNKHQKSVTLRVQRGIKSTEPIKKSISKSNKPIM